MLYENFESELNKIRQYFKAQLSDFHISLYYDKLKFIPGVAWGDIVDTLIEEKKPTPAYLPTINELKNAWYIWRKNHPEQSKMSFDIKPCNSCHSFGMFSFRMPKEGYPQGYIEMSCICSDCDNWRMYFNNIEMYMVSSPAKIKAKGWIVWPYEGHRQKMTKPVKDMFESIPDLNDKAQIKRINELKQQAKRTFELPEPIEGVK